MSNLPPPTFVPAGGSPIAEESEGKPGLAMSSLVLGILGVVFCWLPAAAWAMGIIAVIHGYKAKSFFNRRMMALAGFVLGIIAVSLGGIFFLVHLGNWANAQNGYNY
jgi:hypothetical protein